MDPSAYLTANPAKLTVAELRRAIVELGSQPVGRMTKAELIGQFRAAVDAYREAQGRASTRLRDAPAEASPNIADFLQGPAPTVNFTFSPGRPDARGREDLTQAAFDFTGAFNPARNEAIQAQVAADRSRYHDNVTPMRQLKSKVDIERTPGERKEAASTARSMFTFTKTSMGPGAAAASQGQPLLASVATIDQSEHEISIVPDAAQSARASGLQASMASTAGHSERDPDLSRAYRDCDMTMTRLADIIRRGEDSMSGSRTVSQGQAPPALRVVSAERGRRESRETRESREPRNSRSSRDARPGSARKPGGSIAGSGYTGPRPRESSTGASGAGGSGGPGNAARHSARPERLEQSAKAAPLGESELSATLTSPNAAVGRGARSGRSDRSDRSDRRSSRLSAGPGPVAVPVQGISIRSATAPKSVRTAKLERPAEGPGSASLAKPEPAQFKRPRDPAGPDARRQSIWPAQQDLQQGASQTRQRRESRTEAQRGDQAAPQGVRGRPAVSPIRPSEAAMLNATEPVPSVRRGSGGPHSSAGPRRASGERVIPVQPAVPPERPAVPAAVRPTSRESLRRESGASPRGPLYISPRSAPRVSPHALPPEPKFTYHARSLVDNDEEIQDVKGKERGMPRLRLRAPVVLLVSGAAVLFLLALVACFVNAAQGRLVFTVPGLSNLLALALGGVLAGPQPTASRSYVAASYGVDTPCPAHGICEGGALVSCEAGYSLSPIRVQSLGKDLPARWSSATRTFGNRLYYVYYPLSFAARARAWGGAEDPGSSQLADGSFENYLERPHMAKRQVCLSDVDSLRTLDRLLGQANQELLRAKGKLLCSSGKSRNIRRVLEYTPLYKLRAFQDYLKKNGLYIQHSAGLGDSASGPRESPATRSQSLKRKSRRSYKEAISASLKEDLLREEILAELAEQGVVVGADEVDALVKARVVSSGEGGESGVGSVELPRAEDRAPPPDPYAGIPRVLLFREDAILTLLRNGLEGRDPEVVSVIPPALTFRERLVGEPSGETGRGAAQGPPDASTVPPASPDSAGGASTPSQTPDQAFLRLLEAGEISRLAMIEVRSTGEPVFTDFCLVKQWIFLNPAQFVRAAVILTASSAGLAYAARRALRKVLVGQLVTCTKNYLEEYREECVRRASTQNSGTGPSQVYLGSIRSDVLCEEVIDLFLGSPGFVPAWYRRRLGEPRFAGRCWEEVCDKMVSDIRVDRFFTSEGMGRQAEYFMWSPDQRRRSSGILRGSWGVQRRGSDGRAPEAGEGRRSSKIRFSDKAYKSMDAAPQEILGDEHSPTIED